MIEVVCGVIRDEKGKVLACRRAAGRHLGGLWEFPGGKVEPGEEPERALVRELLEELGVVVLIGRKLESVVEWTDGEVSIRLSGYLCDPVEGTPAALEHAEIRWCETGDLRDLEWAEADVPIVRELGG